MCLSAVWKPSKVFRFRPRTSGSKWTWPPGSPSIPQSLPVTGHGWCTQRSTLNLPAQKEGFLYPSGSSLHNPNILVSLSLLLSFFSLHLPSPHLLLSPSAW